MHAVELKNVSRHFGPVKAVDGVDLSIAPGEFFAMLGPSGSGKTTLLRLIAGFEQPDAGHIEIFGETVEGLPPYRRAVNTVFQDYALFPHLSVGENVAYGLRVRGVGRADHDDPVAGQDLLGPARERELVATDDRDDLGLLRQLGVAQRPADHLARGALGHVELDHLDLAVGEHVGLARRRDPDQARDRLLLHRRTRLALYQALKSSSITAYRLRPRGVPRRTCNHPLNERKGRKVKRRRKLFKCFCFASILEFANGGNGLHWIHMWMERMDLFIFGHITSFTDLARSSSLAWPLWNSVLRQPALPVTLSILANP